MGLKHEPSWAVRPLVERRLSGNADFIILLLGISALTRLKDEPEEVKGRSDRLIEKSDQGGKIRRLEKNKIVFEKKWMKKIVSWDHLCVIAGCVLISVAFSLQNPMVILLTWQNKQVLKSEHCSKKKHKALI